MSVFADLSIIVPVGPGEQAWKGLVGDLEEILKRSSAGGGCEVLFIAAEEAGARTDRSVSQVPSNKVSNNGPDEGHSDGHNEPLSGLKVQPEEFKRFAAEVEKQGVSARWIGARAGRARQLNEGARLASRRFLWFIHSDSRLTPEVRPALERALVTHPDSLIYFDLQFYGARRPRRMAVNTVGARVRSRWLGMPYGDQAFCIRKDVFERLGGYPEDAPYGEDHLLVWSAHRNGVFLRRAGAAVSTSSRKYEDRGWGRVTFMTMYLGARQAFPQWLELRRERCGKGSKSKEVFG